MVFESNKRTACDPPVTGTSFEHPGNITKAVLHEIFQFAVGHASDDLKALGLLGRNAVRDDYALVSLCARGVDQETLAKYNPEQGRTKA